MTGVRGGALGAFFGFVIGGAPLPIMGLRELVTQPDAAGEIAYTSAAFSRASFATGWMMTLAYFIVAPGKPSLAASPATSSPASTRWSFIARWSPGYLLISSSVGPDRHANGAELSRHPSQRHLQN